MFTISSVKATKPPTYTIKDTLGEPVQETFYEQELQFYKFIYIDNYAIKEVHLWKDNIHLNTDGIYKLANNYICHLNRPSLLPFENIWN